MSLYVRAYEDYSYEIIYLEGVIRKSRVHILINPGKKILLPGQQREDGIEINIESLTHILCMETSMPDPKLIDRTVFIAERTNKPIITNQETAQLFRDKGLSVRQLRIIGFEQEVVEGIHVDPVYIDELGEEIKPVEHDESGFSVGNLLKKANPLSWKPVKKITQTILPIQKEQKELAIDDSNPLAFHIVLGSKLDLLLPLDKRGVEHINKILPQLDVRTLIVPNQPVAYTSKVVSKLSNLILLNKDVKDDQLLLLPKTHNPGIRHDTYYGGLEEWVEIK